MTTPQKPRSMDDPDLEPTEPTEEELRAAEALRDALDLDPNADPGSRSANEDAEFARALALAHHPRLMAPEEHRAILDRALAQLDAAPRAPQTPPTKGAAAAPSKRGGVVVRVAFGTAAAAALSLAAAYALMVSFASTKRAEPPAPAAAAAPMATAMQAPGTGEAKLAVARSTQPLFGEPFPTTGGTSARIDRIARARASDLRDNRFARWGVR
ncbi:hypothetical protein [Pendulispora albinea]|uniref:Uncharacterized protein n=1 Tax=Pendulispora albinea TaxID=2741071 RepID=A0ABZ2LJW0_9BACT